MILTERFDDALIYAARIHRQQTRKGKEIPYLSHLLSVSALVIEHGETEDQAIAGLLHDAVEDQGGGERLVDIRRRYGDAVAQIVSDCTDAETEPKPPWRPRKEAYIASLAEKPEASLLVSLADKTHNAEAILNDYREVGDDIWNRFTGRRDGTHWYYRELVAAFRQRLDTPLVDRLAAAVQGFAHG